MKPPPGYEPALAGGARAFVLPGERAWVEEVLRRSGTLYDGAAMADDVVVLQGRRPVYAVASPGGRRVVRRYHRGGAVARLLGDLHLRVGAPRPWREAGASEEVRRRGIRTPRVLAGAVYPAGPFYRADLVTEYVAGSVDLAAVLFGGAEGPVGPRALERAGGLVARMAAAGVRHPDLNAKNVLLAGDRTILVDLDRCRPTPDGAPVGPEVMLARLERSLRKYETITGRALGPEECDALRAAALAPHASPVAGHP